jgi:transcriptional regulator with XRE-family HTH domain
MSQSRAKRLRQALNLRGRRKLYAFADEIGVSPSSLTRWLQGHFISIDHAIRVCQALEISLDWFLLGKGALEGVEAAGLATLDRRLIGLARCISPEALGHLLDLMTMLAAMEPPR